jgi:hypothetical protein
MMWVGFFVLAMLIANAGAPALPYSVNQKIGQAIPARVDFKIADAELAAANILAARETAPSRYTVNRELIDRIAGDLTAMFEAAQAETFAEFEKLAQDAVWSASTEFYERLHNADEVRRKSFMASIRRLQDMLPNERTVRPTATEDRDPPSKAVNIVVRRPGDAEGESTAESVPKVELVPIASTGHIEYRAERLGHPVRDHPAARRRGLSDRGLEQKPHAAVRSHRHASGDERRGKQPPPRAKSSLKKTSPWSFRGG